jgi:type III pantothenate kinase
MSAGAALLKTESGAQAAAGGVLLVELTDARIRWTHAAPDAAAASGDRAADVAGLRRLLGAVPAPGALVVANAGGAAAADALRAFAADAWGLTPEFLAPRAHAPGLACPEWPMVGVDRWLAMIGAARRARGSAFAVVTCGTALAIDLVDAGGRHRGGYVVPGVARMREALFARTGSLAALTALASPAVDGLYGVNTAGAIAQGARIGLASLASRALGELAALQPSPPRGYVAGDECDELRDELAAEFEHVPDLVLEGLAIVATEAPR